MARSWCSSVTARTPPARSSARALLDVRALAAALEGNTDLRVALEAYARQRRFHVKLYQAMSRIFTPFYQSDSTLLPLIRDQLVAPLSRVGPAQRVLAAIVSGTFGLSAPADTSPDA
jgi:salicylate hydroxylase